MKRITTLVALTLAVVAVTVAAAYGLTVPSPPYGSNSDCLQCHDVALDGAAFTKVDFSASSVNKVSACNKCHWPARHVTHGGNREACSCHPTWNFDREDLFIGLVPTPYGYFNEASSADVSASELHDIHVNGSWPRVLTAKAGSSFADLPACASCHAPASCSSCHEGALAHGQHPSADPAYTPVTQTVAVGGSASQPLVNTTVSETSYCTSSGCHETVNAAISKSETIYPHTSMVYTGSYSPSTLYTTLSNQAVATRTFTGSGDLSVYFYCYGFAGIAEVRVDGESPEYIDTFALYDTYDSSGLYNRGFVVARDLPPGTHTVTIRNTGLKNPAASAANIALMSARLVTSVEPAGFVPTCMSCHDDKVGAHGYDTIDHEGDVGASADPGATACASCHSMDLLTEHERSTSASAGGVCVTCHPSPRDTYDVWADGCEQGGCHAAASASARHGGIAAAHTPAPAAAICADCHQGDLGSIHAEATTTTAEGTVSNCNVCHSTSAMPSTNDCTQCHFTFDEHYDSTLHTSSWTLASCGGAGCHDTRDLMGAHVDKNPAFECAGCHASADPDVVAAIRANDTACGSCHDGVTETTGHRDVHWANPPLVGGVTPTPFYSYWTGTSGTAPTTDCAGCHVSNLVDEHLGVFEANQWTRIPRYASDGSALTCDSCHRSVDGGVATAILLGQTACDSCHVIHGPIPAVHESSYVDSPALDCGGCHDSDLSAIHSGTMSTTTPSGTVLTGCAICHDNFEGERGSVVQAAISITNDTRCTACHAEYHANSTSHLATGTSSVDECGPCHDKDPAEGMDVQLIHADADLGGCKVCHENASRVPDITAKTAECASCHASEGVDYHRNMDVHLSPSAATCSNQCHHRNPDVTAVHADCTTCHNDSLVLPADTSCTNCHETQGVDYHLEYDLRHVNAEPATLECVRCHKTADVRVVHDTAQCATCHTGNCSDCHEVHGMTLLRKTTACASCHDIEGTNYHAGASAAHTFSAIDPSCVGTGCHVANTLPEEHERFLTRYTQYSDTCALCHLNENADRIDWTTASADCSSCHALHTAEGHTATSSPDCTSCHDANVMTTHAEADLGGCAVCHANPDRVEDISVLTVECSSCHSAYGVDYHRNADAVHIAPDSAACVACHETDQTRDVHPSCQTCHVGTDVVRTGSKCVDCHAYTDDTHYEAADHAAVESGNCTLCHYMDMKAEHFKTTSGPVSCVTCHEVKVDAFTTAWDRTCTMCHPTKHGDLPAKHASTRTDCGGSGCHYIADVSVIHDTATTDGCERCHTSPVAIPVSTDCATAGCHPTATSGHHESHNATTYNPSGCSGCHFMYLDDEHLKLGLTCATCHASTNSAVVAAITSHDRSCRACHPNSAHRQRQDIEFGAGNASMHRAGSSLPGMRSSFSVNGATYTMALPAASSFLKSGYTTDTMLTCESCHTYTGANGPHGATVNVNIDPAYPTDWATVYLRDGTTLGMSSSTTICAKCHDLNGVNSTSNWSNNVHKEGDHQDSSDGKCVNCHVQVPHGWGRPRLLGSVNDAAGYATATNGLNRFALKNYTPQGWNESDCYAACAGDHDRNVTTAWPNVLSSTPAPTTGTVSGKVTAAATGLPLAGATIALSNGASTTSAADGSYTLAQVSAGTYTLTVNLAGYATTTQSVTVTAGSTSTINIALAGDNLALGKTFTASRYESSTYAPAKAGDGDTSTSWWSNDNGGASQAEWLKVDLGSSTQISKVEIVWNTQYAKSYTVATSTDNINWTTVFTTTAGDGGTDTITFTARNARYVRVYCIRTSGASTGYRVSELRLMR